MTTISKTPDESEIINLNSPLKFNNFKLEDIDMGETVNVTMLIDNSQSMHDYKDTLNDGFRMMIEKLQKIHQAPKIFLSIGTFGTQINVLTGFQPISNVNPQNFNPNEGGTKLYEGCEEFLKNIIQNQQDSMKAGINTKNILFILTDGADNSSNYDSASRIKKMIAHIEKDEQSMGNFGALLCGIGEPSTFEHAKNEMGIKHVFVIDSNLTEKEFQKEFIKLTGILSQSISSASSSAGAMVNFNI